MTDFAFDADRERFVRLERLRIVSPLGIRFWDAAQDAAIDDGLAVAVWPKDAPDRRTWAYRTSAGVYAVRNLPGLRAFEYPPTADEDPFAGATPPAPFIVEVFDRQGRYLTAVATVKIPYRHIFPTETVLSPIGPRPPGFYLFSAPTRAVTASLAVIRTQIEELQGDGTRRPAAFAHLEVTGPPPRNLVWHGVADDRGCAAVIFPYPDFTGVPRAGSPFSPFSPASPLGLRRQRWTAGLRVSYKPGGLEATPGTVTATPDIRDIFNQQPRRIVLSLGLGPPPVEERAVDVVFGQESVVRTEPESVLLLEASV